MVTVSCLIVVASLFSQVISNTPVTGTYKLIDMYFLYFIVRLLLGCCYHTVLDIKIRKQKLRENDNQQNYRTRCQGSCRLSKDISFFLFKKIAGHSDVTSNLEKLKIEENNPTKLKVSGMTLKDDAAQRPVKNYYRKINAFVVVFASLIDNIAVLVVASAVFSHQQKAFEKFYQT